MLNFRLCKENCGKKCSCYKNLLWPERELWHISYWTCSKLIVHHRLVFVVIMDLYCNHCDILTASTIHWKRLMYTEVIMTIVTNKPRLCMWQMSWLLLSVRFSPHYLLPLRKFFQLLPKRGNSALQWRQVGCYRVWCWEMGDGFVRMSAVHCMKCLFMQWNRLWCNLCDVKV